MGLDLGKERDVALEGRTLRLGRLQAWILHEFRDMVAEKIGPIEKRLERLKMLQPFLSEEDVKTRIREIEDEEKQLQGFTMSCPLAQRFFMTEVGGCFIIQRLLKKHQPTATEDDALEVVLAIGKEEDGLAKTLAIAQGTLPNAQGAADQAGRPA